MLTLQKQQKQGISLVELNLRLVQILTKCNANSVTRPIWIEMFPLLILLAYVITLLYYIQISSGRSHKTYIFCLVGKFRIDMQRHRHRSFPCFKPPHPPGTLNVVVWHGAMHGQTETTGSDGQTQRPTDTATYWTVKCCSTAGGGKHGFCVSQVFVSFPKHWPCQSKSFKPKNPTQHNNLNWSYYYHFSAFAF